MNISDLLILYDYNYWATGRILAASVNATEEQFLAPTTQSFGSLRATLVHILDAEYGWRMLCQHNSLAYFESIDQGNFPTRAALERKWHDEEQAMRDYLSQLRDNDLTRIVRYALDTGQKRERVLWHCLVHVVNHGTHHRSQAAAILKQYGHSPGELDFTVFLNERR
jgi:uncharacterized damage-inducible protein DinB